MSRRRAAPSWRHRSMLTPHRVECAESLGGRILDCGAGAGEYLDHLRGEVVALDRDPEALAGLAHRPRVLADAGALPFADRSFDAVWACAVAQYLELDGFVAEAKRVTRPGGRLLILVPNGRSPWDRLKRLLGMPTWWDQEGILTQYSVDDLERHGEVTGEVRFLPGERLLRRRPRLGHSLMLHVTVDGA